MSKHSKDTEIHLTQYKDQGYALETSGTPEDLGEAVLSLLAWFIKEFIIPEKQSDFILCTIDSIKRKLDTASIKSVEVHKDTLEKDIEKILKEFRR